MQVELSIRGLRLKAAVGNQTQAASALIPGSGLLVVATEHAGLQVYDVLQDRQVDHMQVSPSQAATLEVLPSGDVAASWLRLERRRTCLTFVRVAGRCRR